MIHPFLLDLCTPSQTKSRSSYMYHRASNRITKCRRPMDIRSNGLFPVKWRVLIWLFGNLKHRNLQNLSSEKLVPRAPRGHSSKKLGRYGATLLHLNTMYLWRALNPHIMRCALTTRPKPWGHINMIFSAPHFQFVASSIWNPTKSVTSSIQWDISK